MGDKWSLPVLSFIDPDGARFAELRRNVDGISGRMLTATLRSLEQDGLVIRIVRPTAPPQVDYQLTPDGRALLNAIDCLAARYADHYEKPPAVEPGMESEPAHGSP
ncbi:MULTISPECIES: helix-turn-helix domain-containing protein [Streptomyces]|jgi:DNA-binding HxlR family transcriptional regulator|uniref:winged helix-turn-helix transcriptional regulator n=1 Tax=Streptomyces TaxID=1883 RepID=UPI000851A7D9|nr:MULTISPECIES: helix-turn-helix domain-containing protein [Streptomyces]WSD85449.1 helix-turn-helix transcriptional regulator [Streptomyces canus]